MSDPNLLTKIRDTKRQSDKVTALTRPPLYIGFLLLHRELIEACGMVYMIVDNRAPEDWPAFAQWWEARRALVGPQQERTDILWVQATHANGLRAIPYYWAGVFVLEAARFLFPKVHFGLIDNDSVPVTLFEVQDLIALAENQFKWPDLIGYRADPDLARSKPGTLLFTEAHLEYNAGLVISIGSPNRPSPIESTSTAEDLAEELEDYRQQLLAMAAPQECPTEASQGGSLFTPLIGVPIEHSLDLAVVWALYGTYMRYQFWQMPGGGQRDSSNHQTLAAITWPKRAHPGALTKAGQERTPWLTSWARATFEQGCLSVLPRLEGPYSLPGEHLFQASRIAPDRMRPVIFHAFGKAKLDAPDRLGRLARLGWETLPIALLGMPHYPAAWSHETWKPIGGCSFTGGPCALTGNSAFRCCLLLQWHAIVVPPTVLSFQMLEKKTTVMSNRLARSLKRVKLFWNALSWLPLPTRTPVSPGPARQRHGKPTNCRVRGMTAILPLHSCPLRPFLCHGKKLRSN